jgi:hypothetical protein
MEARAALYAGSIAKYGASRTPQVSLPGGEVGIDASKANDYYQTALKAAQEIINGSAGNYKLYEVLPNLSDNFAALFLDKTSVNQESIFIEDFKANGGKTHGFTINDQPFSFSDEGDDAGRLNPSLNFVEAFEKLDNTYAPLATTDAGGNFIYYDEYRTFSPAAMHALQVQCICQALFLKQAYRYLGRLYSAGWHHYNKR